MDTVHMILHTHKRRCFRAILFLAVACFGLVAPFRVYAKEQPQTEEILEGIVENISDEAMIIPVGSKEQHVYQKLDIRITRGSLSGDTVTVENGRIPVSNLQKYSIGDMLVLSRTETPEGEEVFYVSDYVRRNALFRLSAVFALLVVLVGGMRGATSLFGMAVSFGVIVLYVLPSIIGGADPVQTSIIGSLVIIPVTFFLSHGLNRKTIVAVSGTLIALVITGFLAQYFVNATHLTGFSSEEAGFLQALMPGRINIRGLLLAGIIIGVLGVLDDITVSQSAIVEQLASANPALRGIELYRNAMSVGKDHIASMVNTLVLVYTGASLPLLLLFVDSTHPFTEIINYELVADEIVRTLVGSIGLVLAVPITTALSVLTIQKTLHKHKKRD